MKRIVIQCKPVSQVGPALLTLSFVMFVCLLCGAAACRRSAEKGKVGSTEPSSISFQGTWTATGNRDTLRLSGERRASVSTFEGSIVLEGASRPAVGFRAEAIIFSDSETGIIGRAVWTDERGQQIFSELSKQGLGTNITGTIVGGTGRYAGITGNYEFSWRFLIENEDGNVQGQSVGLNGTVRLRPAVARNVEGGSRS